MTWKQIAKETWVKAVSGIIATAGLGGIAWLGKNIVTSGDLNAFVGMIVHELKAEIEPLKRQTEANTESICVGRKAVLGAAIRDLRVELDEMNRDKAARSDWTRTEELLRVEWSEDLAGNQSELAGLEC